MSDHVASIGRRVAFVADERVAALKAEARGIKTGSAPELTRVSSAPKPVIKFLRKPARAYVEAKYIAKAVGLEKLDPDAEGDLRLVSGIVLEPDVVDSQGDTYDADEIRKTAHLWMLDFQNVGLQHKAVINDQAAPVESWIAPVDMEIEGVTVKAGTWMLTVKVFDDDVWSAIKKGEINGFSIGGFATREPIEGASEE